jgi:hypothetical protein
MEVTEEENPEFQFIKIVFVVCMMLVALLLMVSCTPSLEKALDKVTETEQSANTAQYTIHQAYPNITAAFSATVYPVQESTDTQTITEKGNVEEFKDKAALAEAKADSLLEALNALPVKPECIDEASQRDKVIYSLQQQLKGLNVAAQQIKADKETTVTKITKEKTDRIAVMQYTVDTLQVAVALEREAKVAALAEADTFKTERNRAYIALAIIAVLLILAGLKKFGIL